MSDEQITPPVAPTAETPVAAPKATRSNPGKKAEAPSEGGPKVTKYPDGTVREDY